MGSYQPRDQMQVSLIAGGFFFFFTSWAPREAQEYQSGLAYPFSSGSSRKRNQPGSSALQVDYLPTELSGKPLEWKENFKVGPESAFET